MSHRRDLLLLVAGLASVGFGVWLLFAPGTVPGLGPLASLTDLDTATQVGLLLGLVVVVLAAFQMRRTARTTLDRSDLLDTPPERADEARLPPPSAPLVESYARLSGRIEQIGRAGWHVAAYGRRAEHTTDLSTRAGGDPAAELSPQRPLEPGAPRRARGQPPQQSPDTATDRSSRSSPRQSRDTATGRSSPQRSRGTATAQPSPEEPPDGATGAGKDRTQGANWRDRQPVYDNSPQAFRQRTQDELLALLDEVAVTARDTYVTATGCDEATAERAVATGAWTDDRIAAAFLATDRDAPTFTISERALAWLAPRRTLDRRVERTLDAIEAHADSYLTYRTASGRAESNSGDDR